MTRKVIIYGSSRNDGNTSLLVEKIREFIKSDLIDLNDYQISYYNYEHKNANDDYLPLMRKLVENYDLFIFSTPVYWYSMSGVMKVFFDRITDLLEIDINTGKKLRGKKMAVMSSSVGNNLGAHFWLPFSETAKYLGMEYIGNIDICFFNNAIRKEDLIILKDFARKINAQSPLNKEK